MDAESLQSLDTVHQLRPAEVADEVVQQPLITSLGLAVIDEIHFGSGEVVTDVLGGSGTYCTIGARLLAAQAGAKSISWLIHAGCDFPFAIKAQISTWGVNLCLRTSHDALCTRGLLVYKDTTFGPKSFRYTTPVTQVSPQDLADTDMLSSQYFHTLCPPDRIKPQVEDLLRLRLPLGLNHPFVVWEPSPPSCTPENLQLCIESVKCIDVFSPNHLELLSLFGLPPEPFNKHIIQALASRFLKTGVGSAKQGAVVVRAGEYGCLVMSCNHHPVWLPPFYSSNEEVKYGKSKIVDTTWAGNAFLGGFIVGHNETADFVEAACYGSVAASFVLEQIGVPHLDTAEPYGAEERWNGDSPRARLRAYQARRSHVTG